MPAIVDVFDHLRRFHVRSDQRRIKLFVERCQDIAAGLLQLANDGLRGMAEIFQGRTFPEEFGIVADPEVNPGLFP
jgi:hypothetical protein